MDALVGNSETVGVASGLKDVVGWTEAAVADKSGVRVMASGSTIEDTDEDDGGWLGEYRSIPTWNSATKKRKLAEIVKSKPIMSQAFQRRLLLIIGVLTPFQTGSLLSGR